MSVNEAIGFLMHLSMIGVIFIGYPISFTLLFLALVFGGFGLGWEQTFNLAYVQIWGTMKDEIFPAVPLFIFMGYMTEQAGLMERLFGALRSMLARVRGSLYLAVILTATIFAMATGIVGAAVTVLGIMAAPMMLKTGYDARLSAGAIEPDTSRSSTRLRPSIARRSDAFARAPIRTSLWPGAHGASPTSVVTEIGCGPRGAG